MQTCKPLYIINMTSQCSSRTTDARIMQDIIQNHSGLIEDWRFFFFERVIGFPSPFVPNICIFTEIKIKYSINYEFSLLEILNVLKFLFHILTGVLDAETAILARMLKILSLR